MRGWWLGVVAIAACGRIGYAPQSDATPPDYCAAIPQLARTPVIDGELDRDMLERPLALQHIPPVGWLGSIQTAPPPPMPDVSARIALGWHPDGIYFFVDVTDPDRFPATELPYCGDGVELYVDSDGLYPFAPDYDTNGARQLIGRAPMDDATSRNDGGTWNGAMMSFGFWMGGFASFPRPGGYVFEAFIDRNALGISSWTLAAGGRVGVDISINVSTTDGSIVAIPDCDPNFRLGQFFWRIDETYPTVMMGAPFDAVTAFCTATLQ